MQHGSNARRPRFIFTVEESAMIETATNHLPFNAVTEQIVEAMEDDADCRHHGLTPDAGRFSEQGMLPIRAYIVCCYSECISHTRQAEKSA